MSLSETVHPPGRPPRPGLRSSVTVLTVLLLAACSGDGEGPPEAEGAAEREAHAEAAGPWTGTTPGGVGVTVHPPPMPIAAGPVRFLIELDRRLEVGEELTVDLVAPEMPAHGIIRFEAAPDQDRRFTAEVDVPMEGRWLLYVNLDVGRESVPFEFRAAPADDAGEGEDHHHHHHHGGGESDRMVAFDRTTPNLKEVES